MTTIFDRVIADMKERDKLGEESYGGPMMPHDGRDSLKDAYEEAIDMCLYLKKAIVERGE